MGFYKLYYLPEEALCGFNNLTEEQQTVDGITLKLIQQETNLVIQTLS